MSQVYHGQLEITKEALLQIYTIKKNDYTLQECEFRIRIDGKGCNGFTYDTGFSPRLPGDLELRIPTRAGEITLIFDPFSAHYIQNAKLSFEESDNGDRGFHLQNFDEHRYQGKFFKDGSLLP